MARKMEKKKNKWSKSVIKQILVRLPVKLILRFRRVCKYWFKIIKSHDFVTMHFHRPTTEKDHHVLIKRCLQDRVTNLLSVHSNTESLSAISPDFQVPYLEHDCIQVLGPCNGIVCITNYKSIVLCNPARREFLLLPDRHFGCGQDVHCYFNGVGFGADENTFECKVIRIIDLVDEEDATFHLLKAELYRRNIDSWTAINAVPPQIRFETCFETFFQGATHWTAQAATCEMILAFSFDTELFQEFNYPDGCQPFVGTRKTLTVLNEFFTLLLYTDPRSQTAEQFVDIWFMKEYGISESWTKQYTIGPLSKIWYPITSWRDSVLLLERVSGQLISCALDTQAVKEYDIAGHPTTLRSLTYKESLISIKRRKKKKKYKQIKSDMQPIRERPRRRFANVPPPRVRLGYVISL